MTIQKDTLYKTLFYTYFILLPIVAALESVSAGSNKIFNGFFLIVFFAAIFDLYHRTLIDKYMVLFFSFVLSIFIANSLVYGFDLSNELYPDMSEGLKVGSRVLLLALVTYFTFLLVQYGVLKSRDLVNIAIYLVFSMVAGQLLGQGLGQGDAYVVAGEGNEFALQGLTGHVAITASILLSVLPILLIYSNRSRLNIIVLFVCFAAIIFTFRRSAWLIFFLLGSLHLYRVYFRNHADSFQQFKILGFILLGSTGLVLLLLFNQDISQAIMTRIGDLNVARGGTGAGRSIFWGILWAYILDQPLLNFFVGNGYGFIKELLFNRIGASIGAHNDGLDLFLAFGILPLILFGAMMAVLFSYLLQQNRIYRPLLAYCLIALLTLSMTTGGAFDTYFGFLHASIGFALASQMKT